ncbi:MAG TPA: hypothetical protein DCY13_04335 [Verrucomicrobiales bacterium]|nr:hypothetical protein [Verrucomicrobiales bacterium]
MSQKRNETLIYSTVGVAAMLLIVVALNFIFSLTNARIDLTAEKLYTLSDGTKEILGELDTEIEVRLYATQDEKVMPVQLKTYARRVEALLREYAQYANGNLVIRKLDPEPDSDAEDSARLDGIEAQPLPNRFGETVYLGVAFSMLDRTSSLPFLTPNREQLLEYDLTRAISQVNKASKPVVGVMSSLPVMGMAMNPMMMRMGQQGGTPPWVLISELQRDFEVREVPLTTEKIDDDIGVLIVMHPKGATDALQFALDQFVLRGGKLIAMLDPMAIVDQSQQQPNNPMGSPPSSSTLDTLLKGWGLAFESSKVVADMNFARELSFQRGRPPELIPTFLFVGPDGINGEDVATSQLDDLWFPFPGSFSGTPVDGLTQTILISSTETSSHVDGFMAQLAPSQIAKEFVAGGKKLPLAIRLAGRFKTAFPDGKPAAEPAAGDDPADADKGAESDALKESKEDGVVVLFGDVDFANDNFSVQQFGLPGLFTLRNGNIPLVQALTEQLGGDSRLIGARSRATMNRPFTRIREMQQVAEKNYRQKIEDLEKERQDAQAKISSLQSQKQDGQRFVLSPEQQEELVRFQERAVEVNKELKVLRRDLRKDVDAMENRLKLLNIAGMPALVIVVGIVSAVMKRKRTAAK